MRMMMLMAALLFWLACEEKAKQEYRLTDEQLAQAMLDVHYSDVLLSGLPGRQRDSLSQIFRQHMMEIYSMTEQEIKGEILKLEKDPEKLKLILDRAKVLADSIK